MAAPCPACCGRPAATGGGVRVDDQDRPRGEASAYAVQRGAAEASGYEIVGFKIGATAQVAMDLLGVSGPFFGPLFREAFRENDAVLSLPVAHSPGIESEFAVSLAADLPRRAEAWTKEEVEAAVAWVGPAFEIVGTRLEGGLPGAGMLAIADGGANIDFVRGPTGTAWRDARPHCPPRHLAHQWEGRRLRSQRNARVRRSDLGAWCVARQSPGAWRPGV